MWIVFDDANHVPFGPSDTEDAAENWLETQGIVKPYGEQEVSLLALKPLTEKLATI